MGAKYMNQTELNPIERIAIIGLGYAGLPVALALGKKFSGTVGFDINAEKVESLKQGIDITKEVSADDLKSANIHFTSQLQDAAESNFFVVAVPTPIDHNCRPDLTPLVKASERIGKILQPGSVVVYESTVYPGVTEDICGPILAKISGLKRGVDFKLAYSPERINPGDKEHNKKLSK